MPDDIDYGTAERAYDQLYAAFTAGVPVVIANFTVTTYCDCAALRLRRRSSPACRAAARPGP